MILEKFLARIGFEGQPKPDFETLGALQNRFLLSVPFENLDIHYGGEPITLDLDAIYEKIVDRRRGGFCYENNLLMAWALEKIGFSVDLMSAQMMPSALQDGLEDLHLFLRVPLNGWTYAVDVGNGRSFRQPLCMDGRLEDHIPEGESFRFGLFDEKDHPGGPWHALFTVCGQDHKDCNARYICQYQPRDVLYFKEACRFQQQSPQSNFVKKPFASLALPDGRITATPRALIRNTMGTVTETPFADEAAFLACLKDTFDLVPNGPRHTPTAADAENDGESW